MTRVVGTPLRVTEFSSPSDEAISARVSGDSVPRIRIDAGGRITWGSGSAPGEVKLYRATYEGHAGLYVESSISASLGIITAAVAGTPNVAMPDGSILVDTSSDSLYFRSNNTWIAAGAGQGNASLTISDTPPADPEEGDLWFESDTGKTFVYYDLFWVETGGGGATGVATDLSELGDVALSSLSNGDFLRYNSSASVWTNDPINLSTDTIGDYVARLTAGTGVSITNNSGESSSPTIAIGQAVATTSSVTFAAVTSNLVGNADTASQLQTARTISLTGDVSGSVSFNGSSDASINTTIAANSIALGTDTTGNYVASLVAGSGISISNNSGEGATPTISIESTAWTSYTPSLRTNGGTVTLGNGSSTGSYKLIGKTCHFRAKFTIGSTTSIGANEIVIGLPVQATSSEYTFAGAALDNGNAWYEITGVGLYIGSTTEFAMIAKSNGTGSSSQGVSNSFPFSLLDGDYITISGTYEAA